jgi:uncharacterized membrane protein (DUF106 family)
MDRLDRVVVWLNAIANALGKVLLSPIGLLPGWLSATVVGAGTGVLLLAVFKYTSNQRALKRVKNGIKANLLALKLFKDSASVALRAQLGLLVGAMQLMALSLVPMVVMVVPVLLILGQLALWYQSRPLRVGEEAVVTLKLNGTPESPWRDVRLEPTDAVETTLGPVRILSRRELCWNIKARASGYSRLRFQVAEQTGEKELAIGDGFMRVSTRRPGWHWSDTLLHPWEQPFDPDAAIRSIEIDYPRRDSWTSGTDSWVIYWFVVSMVAGLCFRRALNVNL